jgi:hypothetical protein
MKFSTTKKLFAFIITVIMFSLLPQLAGAQKTKLCPKGYKYECYYMEHGFRFCICVPNGNGNNSSNNLSGGESLATNFELDKPSLISIKIYDATGRLVKTLANSRMAKGEHQIEWDRKDEQGNAVSAGTYILRLNSGNKTETRKLSVVS